MVFSYPSSHFLRGSTHVQKKLRHRTLFLSHFRAASLRSSPAMQCDYCESKATVFFTQIIDGHTKKTCLCETCATNQGVTDPEGFLLGDMDLSGKDAPSTPKSPATSKLEVPMGHDDIELPVLATPATNETGICPECGFAFDDLKKTGRLGCSQCYQFFRTEIKHNLTGMHKGTSHTGRVPEGMLEAFEKRQRLEQFQLEMDEAIASEDYEKAASLRDKIKNLNEEKPLSSGSTQP